MKSLLTMLLSLTCFYSCTKNDGTSTGNPLINLNVTGSPQPATAYFRSNKLWWLLNTAVAYPPPATILDKVGNNVILNQFWINISEIEFKADEFETSGEIAGSSVEFPGPYLINVFNPNPQSIVSGAVAQNLIRRIKYKTKKVGDVSGGNPAGMVNASIYLTGTINSNNFTIKSGEEVVYETAGPNLVTFYSGDNLLAQVQSAEIIRKIDMSLVPNNAVISESNRINTTNACPEIDSSLSDVYTCFIKAFQKKTKVGKDSDGNFSLEPGEASIN